MAYSVITFLFQQWKLLSIAVVVTGVVVWISMHIHNDNKVKGQLETTKMLLVSAQKERATLEAQLFAATNDNVALDAARKAADEARASIGAQLTITLNRLKAKPAPKVCAAQIDWLYENAR